MTWQDDLALISLGSDAALARIEARLEKADKLAEALRLMLDMRNRHSEWCGYNRDAPGNMIHRAAPDAARAALVDWDGDTT